MKDLIIGIATLLLALAIIGALIFGGKGTLEGELKGKVSEGISAISEFKYEESK